MLILIRHYDSSAKFGLESGVWRSLNEKNDQFGNGRVYMAGYMDIMGAAW